MKSKYQIQEQSISYGYDMCIHSRFYLYIIYILTIPYHFTSTAFTSSLLIKNYAQTNTGNMLYSVWSCIRLYSKNSTYDNTEQP